MIKSQRRLNYINEYVRLKGEIERRTLRGLQFVNLRNRPSDLEKIAKQSFDEEKHDIVTNHMYFYFVYNLYYSRNGSS
jgi:methyl coenzyme M reductase gamma subunit